MERKRKCVEEIQADRTVASSDTLIHITLIPQRYQIWGTWARDGSMITGVLTHDLTLSFFLIYLT